MGLWGPKFTRNQRPAIEVMNWCKIDHHSRLAMFLAARKTLLQGLRVTTYPKLYKHPQRIAFSKGLGSPKRQHLAPASAMDADRIYSAPWHVWGIPQKIKQLWPHVFFSSPLLALQMGLSENSVPLNPMVLLIIIPTKWLFHWEYTQHFQTNPNRNFKVTVFLALGSQLFEGLGGFFWRALSADLSRFQNAKGRRVNQSLPEKTWVCLKIGYIPNEIAI